jgi:hypothetical protein
MVAGFYIFDNMVAGFYIFDNMVDGFMSSITWLQVFMSLITWLRYQLSRYLLKLKRYRICILQSGFMFRPASYIAHGCIVNSKSFLPFIKAFVHSTFAGLFLTSYVL